MNKIGDYTYLLGMYIIGLSEAQPNADSSDIEGCRKGG